jgi:hypothetical protein
MSSLALMSAPGPCPAAAELGEAQMQSLAVVVHIALVLAHAGVAEQLALGPLVLAHIAGVAEQLALGRARLRSSRLVQRL